MAVKELCRAPQTTVAQSTAHRHPLKAPVAPQQPVHPKRSAYSPPPCEPGNGCSISGEKLCGSPDAPGGPSAGTPPSPGGSCAKPCSAPGPPDVPPSPALPYTPTTMGLHGTPLVSPNLAHQQSTKYEELFKSLVCIHIAVFSLSACD